MSQLSISLLGPPQAAVDHRQIEISRRKAVALLAYLAVSKQSHSRDALSTMFWPEAGQARARAALRSVLWTLNKTPIKDWLLVEPETVSLVPMSGSEQTLVSDIDRFRDLLAVMQSHDHAPTESCADCLVALAKAAALYQNDFMAGFTLPDAPKFDEWQYFQGSSLRQDLAQTLTSLIALHSASRDFDEAIPYARRLVFIDPLHEPAQRSLMQLYAQAGQRSAALRQYEIGRETLHTELGVEPAAETKALYEHILEQTDIRQENPISIVRSREPEHASPHNLAPEPTPFIGREQELSRLGAFLENETARLVTIVGPGGVGKTRLGLAAAAEQVSKGNFPDGVFFVSLAPLSNPDAIVPTIAETVGYHFQEDQRQPQPQLLDYLRQKSMLLLLDNLEQLLSGQSSDGAALVAELLQHAPHLKILTTSRERLNLFEEQLYPLQGLAVSDKNGGSSGIDFAAADLFLQSIRRRQPDYEVAPSDIPFLAEICRLVEGLPLAIELAAPWLEMLSMGEIAAEIQQNLDFLETDLRNVPERHRSLQAVFAASWQSLNAVEQQVYSRLSIFRGGFSLGAAKAVTGTSPKTLTGLVNKSLLHFNQNQKRYEIHELLRQYAAERLTEEEAGQVRDQHSAYFCAMLDRLTGDLRSERYAAGMARIDGDQDNVISAWKLAAKEREVDKLGQAYEALCMYFQWRERLLEGEQLCHLAVEGLLMEMDAGDGAAQNGINLDPAAINLCIRLLAWQGAFALKASQEARAQAALKEAALLMDAASDHNIIDDATRAFYLLSMSNIAAIERYDGQAVELNEESLDLYQSLDDAWGTAKSLRSLSLKTRYLGMRVKALELLKECLAIHLEIGNPREIAGSYNLFGLFALHLGRFQEAEQYLDKSLAIFRTLGNRSALVSPLVIRGISLLFNGKFEACIATNEESLLIYKQQGMVQEMFTANMSIMRARLNLGQYQQVESQGQVLLPKYRDMNHGWSLAFTLFNLGRLALIKGLLAEAEAFLSESAEIFEAMSERSLYPGVLFNLGIVAQQRGDDQQFAGTLVRALHMVLEGGPLNPMRFELVAMALFLADAGETERAIEYYTAALQSPYIANSRWFEDLAGRKIADLGATLPPLTLAAAQAQGQARDLQITAEALLVELEKVDSE